MRSYCLPRLRVALVAVALLLSSVASRGAEGAAGDKETIGDAGIPLNVDFPSVTQSSSIEIELKRTPCFGTCPAYDVKIASDGTVTYFGRSYVAVKGRKTTHLAPNDIAAIIELFRRADFFSLDDGYRAEVTDGPAFGISIIIDGKKKSVVDYLGSQVGMPQSVTELEDGIDRIVGTARWVLRPDGLRVTNP